MRLQIGVDSVGHRSEDELRRQFVERVPEVATLHLTIADLTEQPGEPLEFDVGITGRVPVEQLAENPQCAPQPADRHPSVVNRVTATAQPEIPVEDGIDLLSQVTHECAARGGVDRGFTTGGLCDAGEFRSIPRRRSPGVREPFGELTRERPRGGTQFDFNLSPRQQAVTDRSEHGIIRHLDAEPITLAVGDAIPVAGRPNRRHVHQRLA